MKNKLQTTLENYVAERNQLVQIMEQMKIDYDKYRDRVVELNGSIQATEAILNQMEDKGETDGSESEATSGSNSN